MPDQEIACVAADASLSASTEAASAIERAAEKNGDPAVAAELESAALAADKTIARVGWLRATIQRVFS